jgi:hypothetical protein
MPEVRTYQYADGGICGSEKPGHRNVYHIIIFQFWTGSTTQTNTSQYILFFAKKITYAEAAPN